MRRKLDMLCHRTVTRTVTLIVSVICVGGLYVALAPLMPKIEGSLFPVVAPFEVKSATSDGTFIKLRGVMGKQRDCQWLGNVAYTEADPINRAEILYTDRRDDGFGESRPVGTTEFGDWFIEMPRGGAGDEMIVYSIHRCHALWNTHTLLTKLKVSP